MVDNLRLYGGIRLFNGITKIIHHHTPEITKKTYPKLPIGTDILTVMIAPDTWEGITGIIILKQTCFGYLLEMPPWGGPWYIYRSKVPLQSIRCSEVHLNSVLFVVVVFRMLYSMSCLQKQFKEIEKFNAKLQKIA